MNEQELLQELLQRYPDSRKTLYPEDRGGIATPAGAGMLNGLGARPPEPVTGTGLQTAGGKPTEDAAGAQVIGPEEIAKAGETLQKYKAGKASLDKRIVDNELWFRMGHWKNCENKMMEDKPKPSSGWLFNSIANKHADAMDNYPEPNVLPRAADDEETAKALSKIIPVVLEQCDYEQVYSDTWWRKLKTGTGVKGVFWDPTLRGGLGDISVKSVNLLMLYWAPGVSDIQESPNLFSLSLEDNEQLVAKYPQLEGHTGKSLDVAEYIHDDQLDTTGKSVVVDWYYKKARPQGAPVLHYCKYCNGVVLYASENDPALAERGFYDHGKYPFVFDPLFMEEDSPAGFGYIDVMKDTQTAIDEMNHAMDENVKLASKLRFVVSDSAGVSEEELADFSRDIVHVVGRLNSDTFMPLQTSVLSGNCITYRDDRVNELKEIEFRKYDALPKATTPLTEGVTPEGQALTVTTVTAEVHQYGGWVPLTDMVQMTTIDNNVVQATSVLASQSGRTMDTIVRDILCGGTNVIYAPKIGTGGAETPVTSRAGLDATAQLTVDLIDQAVAQLKVQNADPIGSAGGSYVAIIHPYAAYDIKKDPNWVEAHKYASPEEIFEGEIGKINNVRFVETSEAKIWTGTGCPSGLAVFGTLVLGAHAYATTELEGGGLQHIVKQLGYGDDPLNQRASVGWKAVKTAERLSEQYMVRIESCSARYSAKAKAN